MKNRSEIAKGLRIWGEGIVYEYKGKREFFYGKEQFCIFKSIKLDFIKVKTSIL